jgi:hypothetical protein
VAVLAAASGFATSWAQRSLSTPARFVRRRARRVEVSVTTEDGATETFAEPFVLDPIERALRGWSWGLPVLAAAVVAARLL